LIEAGVSVRNVELGTLVPMFISSLACRAAGFHGPMVAIMRPIPEAQVQLVGELTARYPHAHGRPIHAGNSEAIGIAELGRPDYGDPVAIHRDEVPVFWACGVTPQAVALDARPELIITTSRGSCSTPTCLATGISGRDSDMGESDFGFLRQDEPPEEPFGS
jgi:uncharacterized protein YcsI (UPF0317 family)